MNDTRTNISKIIRLGQEIYDKELKHILEPKEDGRYVAIEIDSKKHFLGSTKEEAMAKARKEFPNKVFFVVKIGSPERISSRIPLPSIAMSSL